MERVAWRLLTFVHSCWLQGFSAYVKEQLTAFRGCEAKHGALKCALIFEGLGVEEEAVYYHADQASVLPR